MFHRPHQKVMSPVLGTPVPSDLPVLGTLRAEEVVKTAPREMSAVLQTAKKLPEATPPSGAALQARGAISPHAGHDTTQPPRSRPGRPLAPTPCRCGLPATGHGLPDVRAEAPGTGLPTRGGRCCKTQGEQRTQGVGSAGLFGVRVPSLCCGDVGDAVPGHQDALPIPVALGPRPGTAPLQTLPGKPPPPYSPLLPGLQGLPRLGAP